MCVHGNCEHWKLWIIHTTSRRKGAFWVERVNRKMPRKRNLKQTTTQSCKCQKSFLVLNVKMSILGPVCFSFPLPFSIFLSAAQTELACSVLLPLSGLGSDKTVLSTWPGQCCAENLVYGPSTEYMSIPIAHDNRDRAGLQQPLCWYQESCRHRVTAKAEAPCLSDTGGKRGSVYFSLLPCYWKISPTSSAYSCTADVLTKSRRSSIHAYCKKQIL